MKSQTKNISNISLVSFIITSISVLIIFYNKYRFIGFSYFYKDFFNIGNIIHIIFYIAFLIGLIFHKKVKSNVDRIVLILCILSFLILISPIENPIILKKLENLYFMEVPVQKLLTAFKFILFEFFFLIQISFLLLTFFHVDHIIYLKGIFITLNISMLLFIFTYLYILKSPVLSEENIVEGNNIGVVLGAAVWSNNKPSPLFQSRIRKAFILLKDKKISKILVMGGNAPGEVTEATAASKMLIQLGVDEKNIMTEEKTSTTFEQIKFIATNDTIKSFDKIIIISDSFHLTRVKEMSSFMGINTLQISSEHKLKWEKLLYFRMRETFALLFFWLFGI